MRRLSQLLSRIRFLERKNAELATRIRELEAQIDEYEMTLEYINDW